MIEIEVNGVQYWTIPKGEKPSKITGISMYQRNAEPGVLSVRYSLELDRLTLPRESREGVRLGDEILIFIKPKDQTVGG